MPGDSVSLSYRLFGEDVSATKALKGVAEEAEKTGKRVGEGLEAGGSHLEAFGEHADTSEQRIMGLKDSVDGLSTIMQGPGEQGIAAYLQGWADLSSGIANFVVPALMKVIPATVKNAVATAWSTTTQLAASAASKAWAAAQWLLNAALSANPIGLIILAIVAFIGIIVLAYNKIGWFRDLVNAAWSGIKTAISAVVTWFQNTAWPAIRTVIGFVVAYYKMLWTVFSSVVGWIIGKGATLLGWFGDLKDKLGAILGKIWAPLAAGFSAVIETVKSIWNTFLGGKGIHLPAVHVGPVNFDGLDFTIPRLAAGGIVPRTPGGRTVVVGEGRYDEAVVPLDGRTFGGETHVHFHGGTYIGSDKQRVGRFLADAWRSAGGSGFANVPVG